MVLMGPWSAWTCETATDFSFVLLERGLLHLPRLATKHSPLSLHGALTCIRLSPAFLILQRAEVWEVGPGHSIDTVRMDKIYTMNELLK